MLEPPAGPGRYSPLFVLRGRELVPLAAAPELDDDDDADADEDDATANADGGRVCTGGTWRPW